MLDFPTGVKNQHNSDLESYANVTQSCLRCIVLNLSFEVFCKTLSELYSKCSLAIAKHCKKWIQSSHFMFPLSLLDPVECSRFFVNDFLHDSDIFTPFQY